MWHPDMMAACGNATWGGRPPPPPPPPPLPSPPPGALPEAATGATPPWKTMMSIQRSTSRWLPTCRGWRGWGAQGTRVLVGSVWLGERMQGDTVVANSVG
jgi:hypothetical protein